MGYNILFYTSFRVSEQQGGTERVTARISSGLKQLGHHCFSAFGRDIDPALPRTEFDGVINIHQTSLEDYIIEMRIDVVIVQTMTRDVKKLRSFIDSHGLNTKIISVLHFNPGYEEKKLSCKNFKNSLTFRGNIISKIGGWLYPIYKWYFPKRNKQLYRCVYQYSHSVVVLAFSFVDEYAKYAGLNVREKLHAIPNPLSYEEFFPEQDLHMKKKQVLIVARMDDTQKRISLALRLWKKIEEKKERGEWNLVIVGGGDDLESFKQLSSKLQLHRVTFTGNQNPLPYYRESRIFMMTSRYEGWGMTLTEAQQMGCVPIAFNTYSSLKDIITSGDNGFIVNEDDLKQYIDDIKKLMDDENIYNRMAKHAILSSRRFQLSSVVKDWEKLFNKLKKYSN